MNLRDSLNVGTWDTTPCGCFIYIDHWVDYKDPANGNCLPDPNSNLVCRKEAVTLAVLEKERISCYIVKLKDPQTHRSHSTLSSHEILHVFKPQTHAPQEIICHTAMTEHNLNELL